MISTPFEMDGANSGDTGAGRIGPGRTGSDQTESDEARAARDEARVRRGFWPKLKRHAARLPFAEDLVAAYYCAFDRRTPRRVQVILLGALAYFVLPFDFIPDMLPVIGFTDDAAVLATAIRVVAAHITPEHRDAARRLLARAGRGEPSARIKGTEGASRLFAPPPAPLQSIGAIHIVVPHGRRHRLSASPRPA